MDRDKIDTVLGVIDATLYDPAAPWHAAFEWAETRTGMRRIKLLLALLLAVAFSLTLNRGAATISNAIGFAYPAHESITLMARPKRLPSNGEAVKWYAYWLTFVAVLMVEYHLPFVASTVPFYHLVKTTFFIWCFAPIRNNGAAFVYSHGISRFLGGQQYA